MKASLVSVGGELRAADHLHGDGLERHLQLLGVLAGAVVQNVVHLGNFSQRSCEYITCSTSFSWLN